jgi:hypothetical protein
MVFGIPKSPQQRIDAIRFTCSCCGERQQGMMDLAKILPDAVVVIPEDQRQGRVKVSSDLCSIDNEHFFVRAVLYVPIRKTREELGFGVWGSLAQKNFQTYFDEFDNPEPDFGPFFSWLSSSLPLYENALGLKSEMVFQPGNQRPHIRLHESDHPLALAQRNGVTVDDVADIYEAWGHTALL